MLEAPDATLLTVAGLVLLVLVVLVVARPLLVPARAPANDGGERRAALEAAKEAKYREIRDAELDHRMGKLSDADYRATDRELRAQAIELLRQLDALDEREPDEVPGRSGAAGHEESPAGRDEPPAGRAEPPAGR